MNIDLKVILTAFSAVFVAELADKTQLVGIGMSSKTGKPFSVWIGSVCAYIIVTAISVLAGLFLSKYLKPELVRYTAGGLFIIIGFLMLLGRI